MAPLRRYLRITKHSVLEVRIYLDRPADAEAWLLKRGDPALPRVIQAIRPLVLPKLREENERAKGKAGARAKKKGVKDVVIEDDFEVSIFLTDVSSRHSVLTKQKILKEKTRIQSNSGKLTDWLTSGTSDKPVVINEDTTDPVIIREEQDNDSIDLAEIPEADSQQEQTRSSTRQVRSRGDSEQDAVGNVSDSEESDLFVPRRIAGDTSGRARHADNGTDDADRQDDKKKLGLKTSYDGFSIYGRILCLIVKRRGGRSQTGATVAPSSQAMLENWVSTQAAGNDDEGD